jgi:hypothetical protein
MQKWGLHRKSDTPGSGRVHACPLLLTQENSLYIKYYIQLNFMEDVAEKKPRANAKSKGKEEPNLV